MKALFSAKAFEKAAQEMNERHEKRKRFKKITGEYPEDVLGEDWENYIDEYIDGDNEHFHEGHSRGSCSSCKMD